MASRTNIILPCALGALSGVAGTLLVGSTLLPTERESEPVVSMTAIPAERDDRAARRLQKRVQRLEREVDRLNLEPKAAPGAAEQAVAEELSEAERRARADAEWQAKLDAYAAQPVDRVWAGQTEASFAQDMRALGNDGEAFEVVEFECRSTGCSGALRFDAYTTAEAAVPALLSHPYAVNCERTVITPQAHALTAASDGYVARIYFDCDEKVVVEPGE